MARLILVDYQNLFKACEGKFSLEDVFAAILKEAESNGEIATIRIFVPNYQDANPWRLINHLMMLYGLKCETCFVLREGAEGREEIKDVVDQCILDWVKENLYPDIEPNRVTFVTHDGDYLFSSNEAKWRKKKEVDFWVINPENTSQMIKRYALVKVLEISEFPLFLPERKENPFITALNKRVVARDELTAKEQEILLVLKRITENLPESELCLGVPALITAFSKKIKEGLKIEEEVIEQALKALIVFGGIKVQPVKSYQATINHSSPFLQWLDSF